jgi:hypothetical protein
LVLTANADVLTARLAGDGLGFTNMAGVVGGPVPGGSGLRFVAKTCPHRRIPAVAESVGLQLFSTKGNPRQASELDLRSFSSNPLQPGAVRLTPVNSGIGL